MDREKIGARLRMLRKEKGETLESASDEIGISKSSLAMYERGERVPRDEVKVRISEYYKRKIEEIFFAS